MKTKTKCENFRVVVEPRRLGDWGYVRTSDDLLYNEEMQEKLYQERCEEMVDQIKRHVDNVGNTQVDCDETEVCSLCGYNWEIDEDTGEPFCCNAAVEEWKKEKKDQ